ncbi:MAG: type 1 glutamine amidotransferase domain-containing protein [Bdellovibrionales bacterium]
MNKRILMPLPHKDFDPTEVSIPWKILSSHGIQIIFSTPNGKPAQCDEIMLTGNKLGVFANILSADENARSAYGEMLKSTEFQNPVNWADQNSVNYDGLLLAGGHDKGMREYLESEILQKTVAHYFELNKPIGAICHGVVLAARSKFNNAKSVLFKRKTTALLFGQEMLAWAITSLWLGDYYRTYPVSVEEEVRSVLESNNDFLSGPIPFKRDSLQNLNLGFVVQDRNYISARWPGDAHAFGTKFLDIINQGA